VVIFQTAESFYEISYVIARGGVIAFRTDTFYGLGADPFNVAAVRRIKRLKGREEHKAILIVLSDRKHVGRFIYHPSATFNLLAETFWPGPLTLIGQASAEVPFEVTAGTETVGVRLPGDDKVRALIEACGGALTATSANPAHEAPAKTAAEVQAYFGDQIDLIVDDGAARSDQPSTVVDAGADEPKLIREGVIPWAEIRKELSRFASLENVLPCPSGRGLG
jgi:L-threonylcarbamoyladenylate synthase